MARALDPRQRTLSIAAAVLGFLTLAPLPVWGQSTARRPVSPPFVNRGELLRRLADPGLDRAERARLIDEAFASPVTAPDASSPVPSIDATPVHGCGEWNAWFPDTSGSVARAAHLMVHDPTGDRLVVFGGYDDRSRLSTDVWTLNLGGTPTWTRLTVSGTPPDLRGEAAGVYDASRNRIVVYGLSSDPFTSIVFQLALGGTPTWTNITPAGIQPNHDFGYTTIYDAPRDRMVVFGGFVWVPQVGDVVSNDVWVLPLAPGGQWTKLAPTGTAPSARYGGTAIFDTPRDRMVVFGGYVPQQNRTSDEAWALSLSGGGAWTKLAPGGATVPGLLDHTAIFDAPRDRMIVFAGYDDEQLFGDTWALTLTGGTSWSKLSPSGVPHEPTSGHAAIYDPVRERMVVFGGYEAGGDEAWSLSLTGPPAWNLMPAVGSVPRRRTSATLVVDAPRARAVLYGGYGSYGTLGDVWTHSLSGPSGWTRVYPGGGRPMLGLHAAVYDSVGERMIVFGGTDQTGIGTNQTWSLALTGTPTWSLLNPSGTLPQPRSAAPAAYDGLRRRMLVFGGVDSLENWLTDPWALDLSGAGAWSQIVAGGDVPIDVTNFMLVYDSPRDRAVLTGYVSGSGLNTWYLPLAGGSWTHFPPGPDTPENSDATQAVFDRNRNRILMHSSFGTFAIDVTGPPSWSRLGVTGSSPMLFRSADAFDPERNRMLAAGGTNGLSINSLWALDFPPNKFSLDAQALPSFGGSVSVAPAGECLSSGSGVTLTAVPARGFFFTHWSGDVSGSANPLTVTVGAPMEIRANFAQPPPECDSWRLVGVQTDQIPLVVEALVYDAAANRMIAGGYSSLTGEEEVLPLPLLGPADWQPLGGPPPPPVFSAYVPSVYDPLRNRVLIYTANPNPGIEPGEIWQLTLTGTPTASLLVPATGGPPPRIYSSLIYDSGHDRLILFGGSTRQDPNTGEVEQLNDVWALDLAGVPAWTQLAPASPPKPRFRHVAIYDPVRDRMIVYGGYGTLLGDVTEVLSLTLGASPAWSLIEPVGPVHPQAIGPAAIYDPVRDRMLLIGGFAPSPIEDTPSAVTALSLKYDPAWIPLSPDGLYPQRLSYNFAAYDPVGDRAIMAGGLILHADGWYNEPNYRTYDLSLAGEAWLDLYTTPNGYGTVTRTPTSDSYGFGTDVTLTAVAAPNHAFDHWTGDASGDTNPLTITMNTHRVIGAVFKEAVVATTISRFTATRGDAGVELSWSFGATVEVEAASVERADQATGPWTALGLAAREENGGFIALDADVTAGQAWFYRLSVRMKDGATVRSEVAKVDARALIERTEIASLGPNPATAVRVEFTLRREQPVRLSVYDVTGREVAVLASGVEPAGRYTRTWGGGGARAGIYFMRFVTPERNETHRFAIVR